jgi:hypothetical protein
MLPGRVCVSLPGAVYWIGLSQAASSVPLISRPPISVNAIEPPVAAGKIRPGTETRPSIVELASMLAGISCRRAPSEPVTALELVSDDVASGLVALTWAVRALLAWIACGFTARREITVPLTVEVLVIAPETAAFLLTAAEAELVVLIADGSIAFMPAPSFVNTAKTSELALNAGGATVLSVCVDPAIELEAVTLAGATARRAASEELSVLWAAIAPAIRRSAWRPAAIVLVLVIPAGLAGRRATTPPVVALVAWMLAGVKPFRPATDPATRLDPLIAAGVTGTRFVTVAEVELVPLMATGVTAALRTTAAEMVLEPVIASAATRRKAPRLPEAALVAEIPAAARCLSAWTLPETDEVTAIAAAVRCFSAWMPPTTAEVTAIAAATTGRSRTTDAEAPLLAEIAAGAARLSPVTVPLIALVEFTPAGVTGRSRPTDPDTALVTFTAAGAARLSPVTVPATALVELTEAGVTRGFSELVTTRVPAELVPVRKTTSPLFEPEAVVISQATTKKRYSLFIVIADAGVHVTTVVTSADVESAELVVPTCVEPVSSVAPDPFAFTDLKTRSLTRPAWDEAVVALTAKVSVQAAAAKMPVYGFCDLNAFADAPVANTAGFGVPASVLKVPEARFVPTRYSESLAELIFATVQPSVSEAAV